MTKRILAYRSGAVGDTILILPVLEALRAAYPGAEITLAGSPGITSFLAGRSAVRKAISTDAAFWASFFSDRPSASDLVLPERYDSAFIWSSDENLARNFRTLVPDVRMSTALPEPGKGHAAEQAAFIMNDPERKLFKRSYEIRLSAADRDAAERFLIQTTGQTRAERPPLLVVHPGSGTSAKRFPLPVFSEAAEFWISLGGIALMLIGPAERDLAACIRPSEKIFAAVGLDLSLAAGILENAGFFLGNDSGMMHLAAGLGCCGGALFAASDPEIWVPCADEIVVFRNSGPARNRPMEAAVAEHLSRLITSR